MQERLQAGGLRGSRLAFGEDGGFVGFDFVHVAEADGGVVAAAEFVPDGAERQSAGFFKERQARGVVAGGFGGAEAGGGFEEGGEEGFLRGAGADDPGGDAIDGGVEVIEADGGAPEVIAAHEFFEDGAGRVVERDDVVAVPTHTAAYVEEEGGGELEDGGNLVGE